MTSCWSSRKAVSLTQTSQRHEVRDTVRDSIRLTAYRLMDTVREVTTITIQLNEQGDTTFSSLVTDRTTVRDRRMSVVGRKREDVYVRTDTVYVEKGADKTVAVAGPGTGIDGQGNIRHHTSAISLLRWATLLMVAIAALLIIIRLRIFK